MTACHGCEDLLHVAVDLNAAIQNRNWRDVELLADELTDRIIREVSKRMSNREDH